MAARSFTTALTLYRSQTLSLEEAAQYTGVSEAKMASALGARGIPVRETDERARSELGAD